MNVFSFFIQQWLAVVSLAVLYNLIFVIGRAVFWEINQRAPALWWTLDYSCDFIYLMDTLIHCHEGKWKFLLDNKVLCQQKIFMLTHK
jgi:hypothetical protein